MPTNCINTASYRKIPEDSPLVRTCTGSLQQIPPAILLLVRLLTRGSTNTKTTHFVHSNTVRLGHRKLDIIYRFVVLHWTLYQVYFVYNGTYPTYSMCYGYGSNILKYLNFSDGLGRYKSRRLRNVKVEGRKMDQVLCCVQLWSIVSNFPNYELYENSFFLIKAILVGMFS